MFSCPVGLGPGSRDMLVFRSSFGGFLWDRSPFGLSGVLYANMVEVTFL
jgi:hypothetical protein